MTNRWCIEKTTKRPRPPTPKKTTKKTDYTGSHQNSRETNLLQSDVKEADKSLSVQNLIKCFACTTKRGYKPFAKNQKNQDSYFVCKNYAGISHNWFIGVCDGHGTYGELASDYVKKYLPANIELIDYMAMKQEQLSFFLLTKLI